MARKKTDQDRVLELMEAIITICINHDEDDDEFNEFVESEIERLRSECLP